MVVRGHVVGEAADLVGEAVVGHVNHGVDVRTSDGFLHGALGLAASEAGAFAFQKIGVRVVAAVLQILLAFFKDLDVISSEINNVIVDFLGQFLTAFQSGYL